jgi:hypothetical protein
MVCNTVQELPEANDIEGEFFWSKAIELIPMDYQISIKAKEKKEEKKSNHLF